MKSAAGTEISPRLHLVYGLPQFAIAYVTLAIVNFAPAFYASEMGLSMLAISSMMLISRGLDVVTDPLIGSLSDRTRSRYGKRKPWIAAGIPVLVLGAWLLFAPDDGVGAGYYLLSISVLFLGLTMVQLPYIAWGAELSSDYDRRTAITSVRERIGALGSAGALLTAFAFSAAGIHTLGPVVGTMALVITLALPLLFAIALYWVPAEPPLAQAQNAVPFFRGALIAFRNPVFRHFALGIFILYFGLAPGGALSWFVFDHYFGRPDLFALTILLEFAASFIGLPLWTALSTRTSKHRALALALLWVAVWTALAPLAAQFGVWPMIAAVVLRSFALGALLMLPFSMMADVIDLDRLTTGRNRTGVYMAFGGIVIKLAITVGVSASLALPGLFGFDPAVKTNGALAEFSVLGTFAWLSAGLFLLAVPVMRAFPLSRAQVAENRRRLQALAGEAPRQTAEGPNGDGAPAGASF